MKKTLFFATSLLLLISFAPVLKAQEFSTGLDIYSSYIWRGSKFGSGPAFQPSVEFSAGDFALGAWGSVSAGTDESLEMDLYASYSLGPVSLAVTDYYFGGDWTDYSATHSLEPSATLALGGFTLMGAYMILPDGSENAKGEENKGDMYFEAGYSFEKFSIGLGAGEGQYTMHREKHGIGVWNDDFGICNINIGTSKEVKITDDFSLPVSGSVVLNPSTGGFFITVGISL